MSNWKTYRLGDLGAFFGGVTTIKKEDYGHGTPFLPYKNVYKNSKININELELMNIRPLDLDRRSAVYGDIFFTASSETPDEVAMSSVLLDNVDNLTFNGFCKRYRLHNFDVLLPEFARYLFRDNSFRNSVYQVATGDIRFNISQESLSNIEITIPDLPTQTQIAQILSSLDDKIELNLQMNKTLEAIAQTIFKEWFVDFNFPGFDGELVNGLPKGWKKGKLDDLIQIKNGYAFKGTDFIEDGIPVIKIKNVKPNQIVLNNLSYVSSETIQKLKRFIISKNTILITMSGNRIDGTPDTWVGKVALFQEDEIYLLNQRVSALELNKGKEYFLYYLTLLLSSEDFQYYFIANATSSGGQANISPTLVNNTEITIPNPELLIRFHQLMDILYIKLQDNNNQICTLTQLRDTLLPKLMRGTVKI